MSPHIENDRRPAEITAGQRRFRRGFQTLTYPLLFREKTIHADPDGLARAERLHRDGHGIVELITHPSRREPHQAMRTTAQSPEFSSQKITGPIAAHQTMRGIVPLLGRATGTYLHPVVTPRTAEKGKANGHNVGFGTIEYTRDATKTLTEGGIVVMAPQTTRKPVLEYIGEDSVDKLLRVAGKKNDKIAIHLIAFGFKGFWGIRDLDDYSKRPGLNLGRQYKAIHGPTFTLAEVRELAKDYRNIDEWAFSELAKIVPKAYLPKRKPE